MNIYEEVAICVACGRRVTLYEAYICSHLSHDWIKSLAGPFCKECMTKHREGHHDERGENHA